MMNGPLVTEFYCPESFSFYKKGIMAQTDPVVDLHQHSEPLTIAPFEDYTFTQLSMPKTPNTVQSVVQAAS